MQREVDAGRKHRIHKTKRVAGHRPAGAKAKFDLDNLNAIVNNKNGELTRLNIEIERLKSDITAHTEKIKKLNGEITAYNSEITNLKVSKEKRLQENQEISTYISKKGEILAKIEEYNNSCKELASVKVQKMDAENEIERRKSH